jgi:hypothetical protein
MRKYLEEEWIRCPKARSDRTYRPEKVWDNGKYGKLGPHRHGPLTGECPYTGLPADIIIKNKTKMDEPKPSKS